VVPQQEAVDNGGIPSLRFIRQFDIGNLQAAQEEPARAEEAEDKTRSPRTMPRTLTLSITSADVKLGLTLQNSGRLCNNG